MITRREDLPPILARFDDLSVVTNDLSAAKGFTLTSRVRNEMFHLPVFLRHYRDLGVERFIFLDDKSTDATRAYLAKQPDCMVVESPSRYEQKVMPGPPIAPADAAIRLTRVWVNLLHHKYATGHWAVSVDADEFMRLPEGVRLPDLVPRLDATGAAGVWGVMLDLYPATVQQLRAWQGEVELDTSAAYFYDAREHLRPTHDGQLLKIYPGCRARLMWHYWMRQEKRPWSIKARWKVPSYNNIRKISLWKPTPGNYTTGTHNPLFDCAPGILVPVEHYKFTGQIYERTAASIERRTHYDGSREYLDMGRLLDVMEARDGSFLARCSSSDRSFAALAAAKLAVGCDDLFG